MENESTWKEMFNVPAVVKNKVAQQFAYALREKLPSLQPEELEVIHAEFLEALDVYFGGFQKMAEGMNRLIFDDLAVKLNPLSIAQPKL